MFGEECYNELDPSRNPVLSLDEDFSLKLHSDTLHNDSVYDIAEDNGSGGIEATDVNSLLAQFEEAADSVREIQKNFDVNHVKSEEPEVSEYKDPSKIKLSDEIIRKIRALKEKKKSTIMLPMGMPSKRGRGSAIALSSCSTSQRLQKIVENNIKENSIKLETYVPDKTLEKTTEVCANYYRTIPEHDYCQNVPSITIDHNHKNVPPVTIDYNDEDILDLEDKETWSDKENDNNDSGINLSSGKRNYRKRDREESPEIEQGNYFDKIPSYYTTLSRKHNRKKTKTCVSDVNITNIENHIPENPTPDKDSSAYSKLPAYYSCFTNSTKYDRPQGSSGYRSRSRSPVYTRSPSRYSSRGRRRTRTERRSSYSSDSGSSSSRCSKCSMCSRSRSRSDSRRRSRSRSRCLSRDSYSTDSSYSRSRSRSRSPNYRQSSRSRSRERRRREREKEREERKQRQIEERRIIYVGKIPRNFTRKKLHMRFQRFGEIEEVSLHFREHGDNYGFVTFLYTCDAYAAIEKGNCMAKEEKFDLCFGGRRQFCETEYADLDGNAELEEEFNPYPSSSDPYDFDALLKQAQSKIAKR